jgi:anti-sigma regulatory factor (Ser/Thr protein kinase)
VRRRLTVFLRRHGASEPLITRAGLAVAEAVNNVVLHAYDGREGPVDYAADLGDGGFDIVIGDNGIGLRADNHDDDGTGFGLRLIAHVTDGVTIDDRERGGVEVWMRLVERNGHGPA